MREALLTSALLKLPMSWPRKQKLARVEALIQQLVRLQHFFGVVVGGARVHDYGGGGAPATDVAPLEKTQRGALNDPASLTPPTHTQTT